MGKNSLHKRISAVMIALIMTLQFTAPGFVWAEAISGGVIKPAAGEQKASMGSAGTQLAGKAAGAQASGTGSAGAQASGTGSAGTQAAGTDEQAAERPAFEGTVETDGISINVKATAGIYSKNAILQVIRPSDEMKARLDEALLIVRSAPEDQAGRKVSSDAYFIKIIDPDIIRPNTIDPKLEITFTYGDGFDDQKATGQSAGTAANDQKTSVYSIKCGPDGTGAVEAVNAAEMTEVSANAFSISGTDLTYYVVERTADGAADEPGETAGDEAGATGDAADDTASDATGESVGDTSGDATDDAEIEEALKKAEEEAKEAEEDAKLIKKALGKSSLKLGDANAPDTGLFTGTSAGMIIVIILVIAAVAVFAVIELRRRRDN